MEPKSIRGLFGKPVTVTAKLLRYRRGHEKFWKEQAIQEREGICIGLRYLQNGSVYFYEDHTEWDPTGKPIPCAMVVFSSKENPVRVPLNHIQHKGDK